METMGNQAMGGGKGMTCSCSHHKVFPVLVVLFALAFLFGNLGWLSMDVVGIVWPILVGVAGVMGLGKCKCC